MNSSVTKKLIHINMIIQKSKLENQINLNDTRQGLTVLTSTRYRKYMFNKQKIQKKQNLDQAV